MAPALNEPLSPTTTSTEKVSKSTTTVTITTVPVTRSNRRQSSLLGTTAKTAEAVADTALTATTTALNASSSEEIGEKATSSRNSNREQKPRRSNTPDIKTISLRKTRSKDITTKLSANNSEVKSKTTITESSLAVTSITTEPMGLTAALRTNTTNNTCSNSNAQPSPEKESSSNNNNNTNSEETTTQTNTTETTQEILANLTINFEEAISAELCLRKQLLDSNLNKEVAKKTNGTELKDILVIKSNSAGSSVVTDIAETEQQQQHMESVCDTLDAIEKIFTPKEYEDIEGKREKSSVLNAGVEEINSIENAKVSEKVDEHQSKEEDAEVHLHMEEEKVEEEGVDYCQNEQLTGNEFNEQKLEQLDENDTLEARLSQLHGSSCDIDPIISIETTSTRTATIGEDDLQELQAQLQLSPQISPAQSTTTTLTLRETEMLTDLPTAADVEQVVEENREREREQNDSTNMQSNIVAANTTELEDQDLEEVLKALKGFDPSNPSADTLCDLNALFGDVYQNMNYEDVNVNMNQTPAISPEKISPFQELQLEIDKTQQNIQRKLDFLVRRLRKMQARHMCKHTSEELAGIFEYTVRAVNNNLPTSSLTPGYADNTPLNQTAGMSVISARPSPHVWEEIRETPVSTTQAYNLMRKLETAAKAQQLCKQVSTSASNNQTIRKPRKSSTVLDTTQPETSTQANGAKLKPETVVPTLDALAVEEITQVAGMLQAEMREIQQAIDSEATESSSDCESPDEMISYNNQIQQPLPIEKRAVWRYARDRAAIASRWSWLLSQIADLEIKIRQHTELYNEIVRKKTPVIDDDVHALLQNENGNHGSCRTHGYLSQQFRKRKLLQTTNIHTISKKAARPSTIKCGCQWPMQPCALCTGRADPTAPRDLPNTMVEAERVALLAPGYHSVLSFPEDVSSSIYYEAVARLSDWQQRAMRCQVKSIAKSLWKAERQACSGKFNGNVSKRRYIKKKDRLAAEVGASKGGDKEFGAANPLDSGLTTVENNGTESATSTTPLVANKRSKQNCQIRGQRRRTITTMGAASSSIPTGELTAAELMETDVNYPIASVSDYSAQKYERYNNRNATMISHKNNNNKNSNSNNNNNRFHHNRNRKAFSSSSSSSSFSVSVAHKQQSYINNLHHPSQQQQQQQQYHNTNGNSSSSEYANNNTNNMLHMHDNWDYVTSMHSRTTSPTHTSSAYNKHERSERKRCSYDINNIVIPYSVAAATRVEIIPYKEIPTPKWRVIDTNNEVNDESVVEDEEEPLNIASKEELTTNQKEIAEEEHEVKFKLNEELISKEGESCQTVIAEEKMCNEETQKEVEDVKDLEAITVKEEPNDQKPLLNNAAKEDSEREITAVVESSETKVETIEESIVENGIVSQLLTNKTAPVEHGNEVEMKSGSVQRVKIENKFEEIRDEDIDEDMESHECSREETCEDITDAVMALRHERALVEERRKFQTYLKFPWTTRSRANRRGDSRAESSGANTPDPTSPAPNVASIVGGDQESIPSPATTTLLSAPSTPFTPMDITTPDALHEPFAAYNNNRQYRNGSRKRRRTTSAKKEAEIRSQTPDNRDFMLPYEPLNFPLNDRDLEYMQNLMPRDRRIDLKQEIGNRKSVGSCGRGRNGLRRLVYTTATTTNPLTRSNRSRLSNRHYMLDSNRSVTSTKELSTSVDFDEFQQSVADNEINGLYMNGQSPLEAVNSEETDDETETCGVRAKNDMYTEEEQDEDAEETEVDDDEDDDEDADNGFPRHPLATINDLLSSTAATDNELLQDQQKTHCNTRLNELQSAYEAYVECNDSFIDGDMDSSDTEPFKDDDPNDPEWNGERSRRRT